METPNCNTKAVELNLLNMIESRIMEVVHIEDECKKKLPKLFNQRLPRFMRRRAACHDPNRLPKRLRPQSSADYGSKSRKTLLKYRQRLRFRKHKRVLKKHLRANYNDPHKSLLHKWFSKRFKIGSLDDIVKYIPLYNNTKNQRNLYRQTRYGCAYYPFTHLMPIQIKLSKSSRIYDEQLSHLNQMVNEVAGFTFCARALKQGRYEVMINLLKLGSQTREILCEGLASYNILEDKSCKKDLLNQITLWVPRKVYDEVYKNLETISKKSEEAFTLTKIYPRSWTRVRIVGPSAHEEVLKITENLEDNRKAIEETNFRLSPRMGLLIGRCIEEKFANFVYYNAKPLTVDIVFKEAGGRLLWHKLVKNKAHLVGGYNHICHSTDILARSGGDGCNKAH